MTENIPPVPPAPQYPAQPPVGYGQPAPQPYAPPPGYGSQPYPQQAQYAPYPPQQFAPPAGQWVPAGPPRPKSSGFRVAAGIIGIVLGFWMIFPTIAGLSRGMPFMTFVLLVAALGNLVTGIVLLAKQRTRLPAVPIAALSFAGFALFLSLIAPAIGYYGFVLIVFTLPLAIPVLVVMGIGLSRERRSS